MFAHRLIIIAIIIILGVLLYKVIMSYLRKRFSAAFREEKKQTLKTRLDELFKKRDELRNLKKSVKAEEELAVLEKEIDKLTKELSKLETKRRK